jgi:hypothetical protein
MHDLSVMSGEKHLLCYYFMVATEFWVRIKLCSVRSEHIIFPNIFDSFCLNRCLVNA